MGHKVDDRHKGEYVALDERRTKYDEYNMMATEEVAMRQRREEDMLAETRRKE